MSRLAVTSILSICTFYIISALPVDLDRNNDLELGYNEPSLGSSFLSRLYYELLRDAAASPSSMMSKRGIGPCINNCLKAGGRMNFIQCKSMCHW
ncbi:hypothetical protein SNE40_007094 [Patella caerulea]|uniref:Uncharacterized protein n=1 Tax=Patella caerulea TaxID=87958 RepID=A0AAN8Q7T9_PATCE